MAQLAGTVGSAGRHEQLGEIASLKLQVAQIRASQQERSWAALHLFDTLLLRSLERRLDKLSRELAGAPAGEPLLALAPAAGGASGRHDEIVARSVRLWTDSARLMHDAQGVRGAAFLEVVQPNQYHGARVFGTEEAKVAHSVDSDYRRQVVGGYPVLIGALPALRAAGVAVVDATGIFDNVPEAVYADDCCHYNQRGNDLLAKAIAKALLGYAASPQVAPPRGVTGDASGVVEGGR